MSKHKREARQEGLNQPSGAAEHERMLSAAGAGLDAIAGGRETVQDPAHPQGQRPETDAEVRERMHGKRCSALRLLVRAKVPERLEGPLCECVSDLTKGEPLYDMHRRLALIAGACQGSEGAADIEKAIGVLGRDIEDARLS